MGDVTEEDLADEFSTFDVNLSNPDVIDKLQELCQMYRLDASEMAVEWVAYSATKGTVELTQDTVEHFDRERLSKRKSKQGKASGKKNKGSTQIYDINTIEQALDQDAATELMGAYCTPGNKQNIQKRQLTPDNSLTNKRMATLGRSPATVTPFSPASFSPVSATPSRKYSSRTNSGEVVTSLGARDNVNWQGSSDACTIKSFDASTSLASKFKYMFQKLTDKAHILNDAIDEMGSILQNQHNIEEYSHVALPAQDSVTVVGRVCCDSNGKLNAKSVLLEGSRDTSAGRHIPVDLSNLPQYSLFPGQIVAMEGINSSGNKFVAKKLFQGCHPPPPARSQSTERLSLVMAAGPFTTTDSLAYEPLADLIKILQKDKPDVCILMGPFVDSKNPELEKLADLTYEELFNKQMELIAVATEKLSTQIIIIPSQRDMHHEQVYPQSPFVLSKKADFKNVHVMSDPCTLSVNGVVIGITSTDILFHLGAEEISSPPGSSDRLARLTEHILSQRSYYPLYPAADDVNLDFDYLEMYGHLAVTPHLLIVPSDLRYFIKNIKGCCCVNPGRLAKGQVGGTYARILVKATNDNTPDKSSLVDHIAGQVLRI